MKKFCLRQIYRCLALLFLGAGIFCLSPDLQRMALQEALPHLLTYHSEMVAQDLAVKDREIEQIKATGQDIQEDPYVDDAIKNLAQHRVQQRIKECKLEKAAYESLYHVSRYTQHTFEAMGKIQNFTR